MRNDTENRNSTNLGSFAIPSLSLTNGKIKDHSKQEPNKLNPLGEFCSVSHMIPEKILGLFPF